MQLVSAHNGKLQTLTRAEVKCADNAFTTGLAAIDAIAPNQSFARGSIHELLSKPSHDEPKLFAATLALAAAKSETRNSKFESNPNDQNSNFEFGACFEFRVSNFEFSPTIFSDPRDEIYPPALAALGFDLKNVYLLRTQTPQDEIWAITQCLRCKGIGAVIASPQKLSRIEARRLQLAAEVGGTVGILLRQTGRGDHIYAAASRWLVEPHPGEPTVQRWKIQLLHGHGGQTHKVVFLEQCRETNTLRATEKLADRQTPQTPAIRAIA